MSVHRLLMISGWACGREALSPLASYLTPSYDVTLTSPVELLQKSEKKADTPVSVSPYAQSLHRVLETVQAPCSIIAWSMGAIITLETVARLNLHINALILLGGTARFCAAADYSCGVPVRNVRTMKMGLTRDPELTLRNFFTDASFPIKEQDVSMNGKIERALSSGVERLAHGLNYLQETDLRGPVADIDVPVFVIHGGRDRIIPSSAGAFLHREIKESKFYKIPEAGHDIVATHAKPVAKKTKDFLEEGIAP